MAHYKGAASEAGRAMQLLKKREQAQMEIEFRKKKIEEDLKISNIENKFAAHYDAVEQQLKTSTIGLVTLDEMKAKQENIVKERERKLAQKQAEKEREQQRQLEAKQAEKNRQKKQNIDMSTDSDSDTEENVLKSSNKHFQSRIKRDNKNRPQELSSKAPIKSNFPKVNTRIDPRFDSLCGTYDEKTFESNYSFLNDVKKKEKKKLIKLLKTTKDKKTKKDVAFLLERIKNQERAKEQNQLKKKRINEEKERYAKAVLEGKNVSFPRKEENTVVDLIGDFDELKKKGRLLKYMKKKNIKVSKQKPRELKN